jgi:hypothetical protein
MTEDEAISILEEELVRHLDGLRALVVARQKDGAPPARLYEALSALSGAWTHTIFAPKRAVLPMTQVDSALCEMNNPQREAPDDLPDSLGDFLVCVEEVLVSNDADRLHIAQLSFGQNHAWLYGARIQGCKTRR